MELHFGVAGGGYGWVFPHKTYYSVGIGGFVNDFPHPKEFILEFVKMVLPASINFTDTRSPVGDLSEK